jgi:DivIVA domain-containing protein
MELTSWWPRPKSQRGIVEELEALQRKDGVAPRPDAGPPPGIRPGGAFPTSRGRGYAAGEVDAFLSRMGEMSAAEIRAQRFGTARRGYDLEAVDTALERFAQQAEAREG